MELKKEFKKIFPEFDDLPEKHRLKKLYKLIDEREDKLITYLTETSKELLHFQKTGFPRCTKCKKKFVKVEEQSGKHHSQWKPDCDCINKNLRLCIG